jgi:octaprenyl-diphosphate synthase
MCILPCLEAYLSQFNAVSTPLHQGLEAHFTALNAFLNQQEVCFEPEVRPMFREVLAHPGKRLRPLLTFGSGMGNGPLPPLVRGAAIVELVHLATLVHDDVLDGADQRHGAPTPHRMHGAHAAVLFGDALFAHALVLASEHDTSEVCAIVARASRDVCSGEVCQTFARGNTELTLADYHRHIRMKTAVLFEASCHVGALLGGHTEKHIKACAQFGLHLGVAYQIYDDLIDLLQDTAKAGKTLGTDAASGKLTLPMILERNRRGGDPAGELRRGLKARDVISHDTWSECFRILEAEISAAEQVLQPIHGTASSDFLHRLTAYLRESTRKLSSAS